MFNELAKYSEMKPGALLERLRLMERSRLFEQPFWAGVEGGIEAKAGYKAAPSFLEMNHLSARYSITCETRDYRTNSRENWA